MWLEERYQLYNRGKNGSIKNQQKEGVGHRVEIDKKKLNNWRWRKTEIKHFFHNGKKPPIPVRELSIY